MIGGIVALAGKKEASLCTIESGSRGASSGGFDLGVGVFGGGRTCPLATKSAFRASTSALEGRPRFFGCPGWGEGKRGGDWPFEGLGWITRCVLVVVSPADWRRFGGWAIAKDSTVSEGGFRLWALDIGGPG